MTWRLAKSLTTLQRQLNKLAPKRDKSSDGTIGDTAHAARKSDHNPNAKGVVQAFDVTDDDDDLDGRALAEALRQAKDPRIKYIISEGKIFNGAEMKQPWTWRKYAGANGHYHHTHISVKDDEKLYDDAGAWDLSKLEKKEKPTELTEETIKSVQQKLWDLGYKEVGGIDGKIGRMTRTALLAFRDDNKLPLTPTIDDRLLLALAKAKPREITREKVAPEKVKEIVPEARSNEKAKVVAVATAGVSAVGAAADGAMDTFDRVKEGLSPFNAFFAAIPGWAWFGLAGIVALLILWYIYKTDKRITDAWLTGARR